MGDKSDRFLKQWDKGCEVVGRIAAFGLGMYFLFRSMDAAFDKRYPGATYFLLAGICCLVYLETRKKSVSN